MYLIFLIRFSNRSKLNNLGNYNISSCYHKKVTGRLILGANIGKKTPMCGQSVSTSGQLIWDKALDDTVGTLNDAV